VRAAELLKLARKSIDSTMTDPKFHRHLNGLVEKKQVKQKKIGRANVEYSIIPPKEGSQFKEIVDKFSSLPLENLAILYVETAGFIAYRYLEIFFDRMLEGSKPEDFYRRVEKLDALARGQGGLLRIAMSQKNQSEYKDVLERVKQKLIVDGLEIPKE